MSSDGYFIDGLQTREEKRSRLVSRESVTKSVKPMTRRGPIATTGDPFTLKKAEIQERRRAASRSVAPVAQPVSRQARTMSAVERLHRSLDREAAVAKRPQVVTHSRDPFSTTTTTRREATSRRVVAPVQKKSGNWLDDMWKEKHGDEEPNAFLPEEPKKAERKEIGLGGEENYRRKVLRITDDTDPDMDFYSDDLFDELRKKRREERSEKREKKPKKKRLAKKVALATASLILVVAVGFYFWGDALIQRISGGNMTLFDLFRSAVLSDGNARFKTASDGRTNILLFGTSGYDMSGTNGDSVHDGSQLTDSIMVLSVNQDSGDMAMISVQRDLLVGSCMSSGKINEVYYCANPYGDNEQGGAQALQGAVSKVLGLDLQYYVHVDWAALISLVDAVGGITVTLDESIHDDWTATYIDAGVPVTLNGERALGLARARHGTTGGDFTRANSQQKILIALKEKVAERGFNFTELINVASVLGDNLRTDFSADEVAAAAKLATTADFASMRQVSLMDTDQGGLLTTGYVNGISYVLPTSGNYNYGGIQSYIEASLANNDKAEKAQILVLNGSGVTGIAAAERDQLTNSNFSVAGIGDAPAGSYFDRIYLYDVTGKNPKTKEKLEVYYNLKTLDKETMPDGIKLDGIDFVVILGIGYKV